MNSPNVLGIDWTSGFGRQTIGDGRSGVGNDKADGFHSCKRRIPVWTWAGMVSLAILMIALGTAVAENPVRTVETTGMAKILGNNVAEAKETALQCAILAALEKAAADILPKDPSVSAFHAVGALFAEGRLPSLLQEYMVSAEGRFGDYYRTAIQATILIDPLKNALYESGISVSSGPPVLILIAEKFPGYDKPFFWWGNPASSGFLCEEALASSLSHLGFRPVSHQGLSESVLEPVWMIPEPEAARAIQLGTALGAEFVLLGMVTLIEEDAQDQGPSVKGLLKLRLLRVKGSDEIATIVQTAVVSQTDTGAAIDRVLRMIGTQVAEEAAATLNTAKEKPMPKSNLIEVTIEGTAKIRFYTQFKQALSGLQGVRNLIVKEMQPDTAVVVVDYQGSGRQLADVVTSRAFSAFSVEIQDVSPGRIHLALIPKP